MKGTNGRWIPEHIENNERFILIFLQWFRGFSTLPCRTNYCGASVSLVLFKQQFFSPYPCTSAKNHRCGNGGHSDFSQCSWQKGSWLQRSEASLNKKKLFKCMLFCKGSFSFRRPQSSASTRSWSPHSSAAVWSCSCLELMGLLEPLQLIAQGFHQLPNFICFLEFVLLKNMVDISRKTTEIRSIGFVFLFDTV